ncbi:MAG TPA: chlorophyllase [Pilimelia sp.]|nr:chlorophyllase [Pilimelia sp.]
MRRLAALAIALPLLLATGGCTGERAPAAPAPGTVRPEPSATATPTPGAAAARTAPSEPYAVGVRTLRLNRDGSRPLRVTIWYPAAGPAGNGIRREAPAADGRFPIVVFSHGLGGLPGDYERLLRRWAAAGFAVAAPAYPHTSRGTASFRVLDVINQPADASYVLTQVLALDGKAGDPLRGRLDAGRVGAAGHSAGGITTLGMFTLGRDERLDAGIVLAGSSLGVAGSYRGPAAPILFVHGKRDEVVSYASGKAAYDSVPWPKALLTLPDAGHTGALLRDGDPEFRVIMDATIEFLRWSLYGDPAAKRRLPQGARAGGVATFDNRL